MNVLITGATGFIGGHVTDALLEHGHSVMAAVRVSSKVDKLQAKDIEICTGSLSDSEFLNRCCEGMDVVINMAGKLGGWGVRLEELRLSNVTVVKKLACAAEIAGVRQFIHCSTPGVVGMVGVAPEIAPYRPMGDYERTKVEAEEYVLSCHKDSFAVTVIRPDFVYGPGDQHKLKMFQAIKNRRFPLIGRGKSLTHPTYVSDVAQGVILMLGRKESYGEVFNIAGPIPIEIRDMVRMTAVALKTRPLMTSIPTGVAWCMGVCGEFAGRCLNCQPPMTRSQVRFFTLDHASDISKAKRILGYTPLVQPADGIRRTIEWYQQEGYI